MSISEKLFERACDKIPGGVNSPVRAFKSVGTNPVYIKRGKGAYIWDVDNKEYIDFCGSWGPLILGHAHPLIVEAVHKTAERGLSFVLAIHWKSSLLNFSANSFLTLTWLDSSTLEPKQL